MSEKALLEFINVSKAFGECVANRSVSFSVEPGTIHALVGENGAGKSTIMKILFGLFHRDKGEIKLNGKKTQFSSPLEAKRAGIGMVHQHFMLAGPLTALDHIFLDDFSSENLFRPLNKKSKLEELETLSRLYGMPVPWNEKIENLSVGFQQRIEILKLLHNRSRILILDEPTAVLTPQEVQSLFQQLRQLKQSGHTILLITHKLQEVLELADHVSVFRQGTVIESLAVRKTTALELSEMMVGRKLQEFRKKPLQISEKMLELRNLSHSELKLHNLNLQVHAGEIVGIAGVEGNGQSELIQVLLNPKKFSGLSGDLLWKNQSLLSDSPVELKKKGFSYLPEDRLSHGALPDLNLQENFILGRERSQDFQKKGFLQWGRIKKATEKALKNFDVRPANPDLIFSSLSGGNQQKLVAAREFSRNPTFLLAAQPTRGVDIGAIERLHSEILNWRDQGRPVLLISSELEELMKLSDRILVMFEGRFVGELAASEFDQMKIGRWMTGATSKAVPGLSS
jgi:ABC-type uncharacterized transport system ATPase subunit